VLTDCEPPVVELELLEELAEEELELLELAGPVKLILADALTTLSLGLGLVVGVGFGVIIDAQYF